MLCAAVLGSSSEDTDRSASNRKRAILIVVASRTTAYCVGYASKLYDFNNLRIPNSQKSYFLKSYTNGDEPIIAGEKAHIACRWNLFFCVVNCAVSVIMYSYEKSPLLVLRGKLSTLQQRVLAHGRRPGSALGAQEI